MFLLCMKKMCSINQAVFRVTSPRSMVKMFTDDMLHNIVG